MNRLLARVRGRLVPMDGLQQLDGISGSLYFPTTDSRLDCPTRTDSEKELDIIYDELTCYLSDYVATEPLSWNDVVQALGQLSPPLFATMVHDVYCELLRREGKSSHIHVTDQMRNGPPLGELNNDIFRDVCSAVRDELAKRHTITRRVEEDLVLVGPRIDPGNSPISPPAKPFAKSHAISKSDSMAQMVLRALSNESDPISPSRVEISNPWYRVTICAHRYLYKSTAPTEAEEYAERVGQIMADQFLLDRLKSIASAPQDRTGLTNHDREQLINSIQAYLRINSKSSQLSTFAEWMTTTAPHAPCRTVTSKARRLLVKLGECHKVVPAQCYIANIRLKNCNYPITGGGFADIFQGYIGDTLVAIKRLRVFESSMTAEQDHQLKRLCREALLWQQIHHPNILPFFGVARDLFPGQLCLVSPWASKGNLITYLECVATITVRLINRLLYQVARGVAYLHWLNIVHGDLRGANILIDDDHHVRLADFGLSVFAEATAGPGTCTNRDGSMAWMAPELIDPVQFGHHDFRRTTATDVYAYACVCLEVYTGKRPFQGLPDSAVLLNVLRGERPGRPSARESRGLSIPDKLWHLMRQCWHPHSLSRPDIRDISRCLGEVQRGAR